MHTSISHYESDANTIDQFRPRLCYYVGVSSDVRVPYYHKVPGKAQECPIKLTGLWHLLKLAPLMMQDYSCLRKTKQKLVWMRVGGFFHCWQVER